jgi:osmotically-inducible protein OsmY
MAILALILGAIGGIGAMFFFDKDMGSRRRSLLRDQLVKLRHRSKDQFAIISEDTKNRAQGIVAETKARLTPEPVSDDTLVARVRAEMGRYVSHPKAITATANQGEVTVSGAILSKEAPSLLAALMRIPGVRQVHDHLEYYESADNIPDLQGGVTRTEMR